MLKNLQESAMVCLYIEHTFWRGRQMLHFLWLLYEIYFRKDALPNNSGSFCRQMINCMRAWNYLQKTLDLPLSTEIIKQAHDLMIEDEKDVLVGEYKKYLQAIIFLHQRVILKDTWKTQFLGFMRLR